MEVQKVTKKIRISNIDAIKYQLITEFLFFRNEYIIPGDLAILIFLVKWGPMDLGTFCTEAAKELYPDTPPEGLSLRSQNIRNRIVKLEKRDIIVKSDAGRKTISITPDIDIFSRGNILLDYNYLSVEPSKT